MTGEQRRLYAAALRIGRRLGVGGPLWLAIVATPATPAAGASVSSDGARRAYVVRERLVSAGQAAPAAPAPSDRWRLIGLIGEALAPGLTLVSMADPTLAFRLGPLDTDSGYPTGVVDRVAAPTLAPSPSRHGAGVGLRAGMQIGLR